MVAFFLLLVILIFVSCEEPNLESNTFTIMNWNVQALMDMNVDGNEFNDFSLDEYDEESYRRRIRKVCDVIDDINADVVILEEIENSNVLKDMLDMYLSRKGYLYYGAIKEDDSAIAIGFISKIKTEKIQTHYVDDCRDLLSLDYIFEGQQIRVLACHARSQINGFEESEIYRLNLAKTIKRVVEENDELQIICVGDFNEDPSKNTSFQTALYDIDKENSFIYRNKGSILVTSSPYNALNDIFYSPQLDVSYHKDKKGTYVYENNWYNFDLILLNNYFFDKVNLEFDGFYIYAPQKICTSSGIPYKWNQKSLCGISDHFPVYVTLSCGINE
ncbi:MAG: endonuclease/exonuclease/phosphatase family protein [Pleomorphochaeta sp.]